MDNMGMPISAEFPHPGILITSVVLYVDDTPVGPSEMEEVLGRYETLYGSRVERYLRMLQLKVGQKERSVNGLLPPFKYDEEGDGRIRYKFDGFYLAVGNHNEPPPSKLTVTVERAKKTRFWRRTLEVTLADVYYQKT